MNQDKNKILTVVAYISLIVSVFLFIGLSSIAWGIFIAWPLIIIGFLVWAVLLTVADRGRGSDKKIIYRRNQKIFLVLLLLVVVVTFVSTVGKSLLS